MSKRRTFTPGFKADVVLEVLTGAKTIAQVSREHGVKESVVHCWKQN
ncbi:MAG: transposase [Anaerolineales bacterium]|nr:transposase [Anaerolineales bacterium]